MNKIEVMSNNFYSKEDRKYRANICFYDVPSLRTEEDWRLQRQQFINRSLMVQKLKKAIRQLESHTQSGVDVNIELHGTEVVITTPDVAIGRILTRVWLQHIDLNPYSILRTYPKRLRDERTGEGVRISKVFVHRKGRVKCL